MHPEPEVLSALALGRLDEEQAAVVIEHVAACAGCQEVLAAVADDEVVALVRVVVCAEVSDPARTRLAGSGRPTDGPPCRVDPAEKPLPVIAGYEILRPISKGGMGIVYEARALKLDRKAAIKVLLEPGGSDEQARFQQEARTVARLSHPHLVQIYEVGEWQPPGAAGTALYLALEYLPGGTLAEVLGRGPLPPGPAAHLMEVLARAIQAAHDAGIAHRDLKPSNVLLGPPVSGNSGSLPFGFPKVADFGLARHLGTADRLTKPGAILGTPNYMAPEQAAGAVVAPLPADVWALGVIFYEVLTGQLPFVGDTLLATLENVRRAKPRAPRQVRAGVSPGLEALCLACLQRQPHRRPTAGALADALAAHRAGRPTESFMPRRHGRRPVLAASAALVLLAFLAAGLYLWRPAAPGVLADPTPPAVRPDPAAALPPLKATLDVVLYEARGSGTDRFEPGAPERQALHLFNRRALPLRPNDWVRVDAAVDRPAYLYLVWIDTAGTAAPIYPWVSPDPTRPATFADPRVPEEKRTRLTMPGDLSAGTDRMPLTPVPAGIETVLLVARDEKLSPAEAAELAQLLAPAPRGPVADLERALWFENGAAVTNDPDRAPLVGKVAGPSDAERAALAASRHIHDRLGGVARGVCFGNQGKPQP